MKPLEAGDLFVFAGAGISFPMPSNLPVFWRIRDAVLHDLGLVEYVEGHVDAEHDKVSVAHGLLPEPFVQSLVGAGVDVETWLFAVLGGAVPNTVHRVLAELAASGARVWTVNFDHLIEEAAGGSLEVTAWPSSPRPGADLMKPHGTLGGRLIVTAEQVLARLEDAWLEQLRADVSGRTVVFVGYSGNDLDFRPVWDDVLQAAAHVLWFDRSDDPVAQARKRVLLRRVAASGRLEFPPCRSIAGHPPNPSYDFVRFCVDERLVSVDSDDLDALLESPGPTVWPPLPAAGIGAEAAVRGTLGDIDGARSALLRQARRGPGRAEALRALLRLTINHGDRPVATVLGLVSAFAPPVGPARRLRAVAHRKRVTILANQGRHRAVLRATRRPPADRASTELILRSASERYLVSLDAAADTGDRAVRLAVDEHHIVRVAHAAYQRAMSLVWAERLDEATECLESQLEPYASLAANRWVAWADFIAAALLVRSSAPDAGDAALQRLDLSAARFGAEALIDGVVSVDTARLTARRRAGRRRGFADDVERLRTRIVGGGDGGRYYARAHRFSVDAIDLELAEHLRTHEGRPAAAMPLYRRLAGSPYPLHRALGWLGMAFVASDARRRQELARRARAVAEPFGARLVVARAQRILLGAPDADDELFFC